MRTSFYINGKKVSKKYLISQIGEQRVNKCLAEARQSYMKDPLVQNDFWLGGQNMLTIKFQL